MQRCSGLPAINRFRLTPALERQDAQKARWALFRTIAAETVLGLMVVLAAGVLSGLEPGMHARAEAEAPLNITPLALSTMWDRKDGSAALGP